MKKAERKERDKPENEKKGTREKEKEYASIGEMIIKMTERNVVVGLPLLRTSSMGRTNVN